ncbi:cytochrome c oxidase subunit I [Desmospora profundinema]|uniref:Cytochrome c oxidase subunit 1 n=1 Tax=Desmospora profundinema TaxID=1571184 RepID=A0ABU1INW1_9BACL|nr:cytochrome c oxidase subunit I [Desmospora profundinema]MDR6225849.1 cytochrome c oxidase subunit 1 [Desmospora profundinema]
MATLIILIVVALFLAAILTGGYNEQYLDRVKQNWLWDWITTVDHKKIGILYLIGGGLFFAIAGLESLLIRIQLMFPNNKFILGDVFNQLLTMHGTTMIFLVALPVLFGLMNVIVPLQIGARDVAFPFLNSLGFWLYFAGGLLLNISWIFGGAPDAGWTSYATLALNDFSPGPGVNYYVLGLQIAGIGTLISGINFLVTIINMRAPGMTYLRLPLFTWTTFVTSALILFAFPPLTAGLFMMMFDRLFETNFFATNGGGNATVWQHIFWIFGHPEVYILVLPAFGVFSDVISTFSKKRLFGYHSMVFAVVLIGFLGFMVWVHHMFTVGLGPIANTIFAVATMAIAVPTGIKVFNWLFTMLGGRIRFTTAMLFATGFIVAFVMGGVTGVMLAVVPADLQFHDTYFVVAHFHYVIIGGVVLGFFSGFYYWWPKIFGTFLDEKWGKWHFWLFYLGFHLTFFPQHFLGLFGMPRRVFTYEAGYGLELNNLLSTLGTFLMTAGVFCLVFNVLRTVIKGQQAPGDPWDGRTLEWSISSPPPEYNFAQVPQIRGLDAWWLEKQEGNDRMPPAEPLGPIHMPSPNYLPFVMTLGFFISGLGFVFHSIEVGFLGLAVVIVTLYVRSFEEDHGYHLHPKELEEGVNGS